MGDVDTKAAPRQQCAKCPWRKGTDSRRIPNGYSVEKHAALKGTIREGLDHGPELRIMACHETDIGSEKPCVGWLANQLGLGNNIALRLAVVTGRVDANVETTGPQHERFEDTLPRARRGGGRRG